MMEGFFARKKGVSFLPEARFRFSGKKREEEGGSVLNRGRFVKGSTARNFIGGFLHSFALRL